MSVTPRKINGRNAALVVLLLVLAAITPVRSIASELLVDTGRPVGLTLHVFGNAGLVTQTWLQAAQFTLTTDVIVESVAGWMTISNDVYGFCNSRLWIDVLPSSGDTPPGFSSNSFGELLPTCSFGPSWVTSSGLSQPLSAGTYWIIFRPMAPFPGWMQGGAPNPLNAYASGVNLTWSPTNPNPGLGVRITGTRITDADGDGVFDTVDNCTAVANADQLDANDDGYGNTCDADLNNSGTVTAADFGVLRSLLHQAAGSSAEAAAADLDGSGTVTSADFAILRARLNTPPGPSGLACAGTVPCPVPPASPRTAR